MNFNCLGYRRSWWYKQEVERSLGMKKSNQWPVCSPELLWSEWQSVSEDVVTAWKMFAESAMEAGVDNISAEKESLFPKKIDKRELCDGQTDGSHVCRESSWLKRPKPNPNPAQQRNRAWDDDEPSTVLSLLKSQLKTSDCSLVVSFVPKWTITIWTYGCLLTPWLDVSCQLGEVLLIQDVIPVIELKFTGRSRAQGLFLSPVIPTNYRPRLLVGRGAVHFRIWCECIFSLFLWFSSLDIDVFQIIRFTQDPNVRWLESFIRLKHVEKNNKDLKGVSYNYG